MSIAAKQLSWKAQKKGPIYCAPACGGGCLRSEFEEATKKAEALAKRTGKHFRARVWENLGWHWSVVAGNVTVRLERDGKSYSANHENRYWVYAKTPKKALEKLRAEIQKHIAKEQAKLDEIDSLNW